MISIGYCQCGCGQKTNIATKSNTRDGYTKGQPRPFLHGHGHRIPRQAPRLGELDGKPVAYIDLMHDRWAIVDAEDLSKLSGYEWSARWNPQSRTYYAQRAFRYRGERKKHTIQMHRELMQVQGSIKVDHLNGNGLDNRRSVNLRLATNSQNASNRQRLNPNNKTGFRGVTWHKGVKKWCAAIGHNNQVFYLGSFPKFEDARAARLAAEEKFYGEFAPRYTAGVSA